MRILFILTYYHPHWTGLTQYAKTLAEGLHRKQHQVRVLTINHQNLRSEEIINGVTIIRKSPQFRFSRTLISFGFILSLFSQIKQSEIVVVYLPLAEVLLVAFLSRLFNKKLYLIHNGDLVLPKGIINGTIEKFYYFSTELAVKLSNAVVVQTEDYALTSTLLSKYPKKYQVIVPPFLPLKEKKQITLKFIRNINKDKKTIIGFAGRFVEEKGFDILIKSIPSILKTIPKTKLVYAGEINLSYERFFQKHISLINKYKRYITFLGRLKKEEMPSFYKLCDVFVVSSRTDCFPFVLVEALLSGIPAVVTDIPGARWSVKVTGMGVIVKPKSSEALVKGIEEVVYNKKKYTVNKEKVRNFFNYEKSLQAFEQLFSGG